MGRFAGLSSQLGRRLKIQCPQLSACETETSGGFKQGARTLKQDSTSYFVAGNTVAQPADAATFSMPLHRKSPRPSFKMIPEP